MKIAIVVTAQNGLGDAEVIAGVLPGARMLMGMTNWPADLIKTGIAGREAGVATPVAGSSADRGGAW